MHTKTIKAEDVRFNLETQSFEALVTLTTSSGTYRYPCAFKGPLNMPLTIAAHRLTQQAKQRHADQRGLRAFSAGPAKAWHNLEIGSDQATFPQAA